MSAALVRSNAIALPLRDASVDLVVTSPPYFALRSYEDGGEHYEGQIGSEPSPQDFLEALWAVTAECVRVLKPSGSIFVNLGDKYAGSGGHNNSGLGTGNLCADRMRSSTLSGGKKRAQQAHEGGDRVKASRRQAPDSYSKATIGGARPKSLMGLPWRYAIGCIDQLGLILRAEIVWSKPNGLPESVTDRVARKHETWFHMTKEPSYFADLDGLRTPTQGRPGLTWEERKARDDSRARYSTQNGHGGSAGMADHPLGTLPPSVWTIATEPLVVPDYVDADHFAAFPQEWPRRLILGWSPPAGVVLDPFGGTGTTAMVARALGRFGISNDLSADYLRLARWRIWHSGHASKSRERTNKEAQLDLLGGLA